jgi:hypothetical protein
MEGAGGIFSLMLLGVLPALPLLVLLNYLYLRRTERPELAARGRQVRISVWRGIEATAYCASLALMIGVIVCVKADKIGLAGLAAAASAAIFLLAFIARKPVDRLLRRRFSAE